MTTNLPIPEALRRVVMSALACMLLVFSGCAAGGRFVSTDDMAERAERVERAEHTSAMDAIADVQLVSNTSLMAGHPAVATALFSSASRWIGTRYRYGGNDQSGIDCSAFTQRVYSEAFGINLPRTTNEQVSVGRTVRRTELLPGDLVLFRTGRASRHVGIYIGEGRMVHASTSRGVIVDDLNSDYWQRSYWTSRRVLPSGTPSPRWDVPEWNDVITAEPTAESRDTRNSETADRPSRIIERPAVSSRPQAAPNGSVRSGW
ncbi:hypothetical protein BH23BAC4_BH23BAC4_13640 [soil metagenome]